MTQPTQEEMLQSIMANGNMEISPAPGMDALAFRFYSKSELTLQFDSPDSHGKQRYTNDFTVYADTLKDGIIFIFACVVALYFPEK